MYIESVYYMITIVTTIGYGNIHGNNILEYTYSLFLFLFGAIFYSVFIGILCSVFNNIYIKENLIN